MRLFVSVAVLGLVAAMPAMAQNNTNGPTPAVGTTPMIYAVPMYNPATGGTYYSGSPTGAPVYNNATQPLALNQMVAGKDAPSYDYNNTRPYTGFMGGDPMAGADYGNLTSEQRRYIDQQAAVRAQQEQAQAMANLQQQQRMQQLQQNPYVQGANQMYNNVMQPEQKPKQRRVVYNERNNPLVTPPRLFDPDQ